MVMNSTQNLTIGHVGANNSRAGRTFTPTLSLKNVVLSIIVTHLCGNIRVMELLVLETLFGKFESTMNKKTQIQEK